MKLPKPHKGIFFYEIQIWFFVFMWQHDLSYPRSKRDQDLINCGKFIVWWDSIGFHNKYKFIRKSINFYNSLKAFLELSKAGFEVRTNRYSEKVNIFYFKWDGVNLKTTPYLYEIEGKYYENNIGNLMELRRKK